MHAVPGAHPPGNLAVLACPKSLPAILSIPGFQIMQVQSHLHYLDQVLILVP
jgi:hypothetical protein